MNVIVTKLTDINLLRKANSYTTNKDSKMTLATAYKLMHTPIRTQLFTVELTEIPLFVASQLVRVKQGVDWWMLSKRTDRGGENFIEACASLGCDVIEAWENKDEVMIHMTSTAIKMLCERFDRLAPTNLMGLMNAETLINIAHKRLCFGKVSLQTREIVQAICDSVEEVDPDLYPHLVPPCIHTGICREHKGCQYHKTPAGIKARTQYVKLFE